MKKRLFLASYPSAIVMFSCVILTVACSLSGSLRNDKKARGYDLGELPERWEKKEKMSTADEVFQSRDTNALLAINSVCDRYPNATLEALTKELVNPLKRVTVIERNTKTIAGREALLSKVSGLSDGVEVEAYVAVLRKGNCIFDLTLFAAKKIENKDAEDFEKFIASLRYEPNG